MQRQQQKQFHQWQWGGDQWSCCRVPTADGRRTVPSVLYKEERTNGWTQARSSRSHTEMNVVVVVVFRLLISNALSKDDIYSLSSSSSSSPLVVVVVVVSGGGAHTKSGEIREHNTQGKEGGKEGGTRGRERERVRCCWCASEHAQSKAAPPNGQQHTAMSSFPPSRLLSSVRHQCVTVLCESESVAVLLSYSTDRFHISSLDDDDDLQCSAEQDLPLFYSSVRSLLSKLNRFFLNIRIVSEF